MGGFGRAPKPDGQRRNRHAVLAQQGNTRLPASGREGEPPPFPLPRSLKAERDLWARLWATPQAVAWEELGWTDVVARYARLAVAANEREAPITLLGECRQLEDRLGLSPMAMLRLRWVIVNEPESVAEGDAPNVLDVRKRFAAVD